MRPRDMFCTIPKAKVKLIKIIIRKVENQIFGIYSKIIFFLGVIGTGFFRNLYENDNLWFLYGANYRFIIIIIIITTTNSIIARCHYKLLIIKLGMH